MIFTLGIYTIQLNIMMQIDFRQNNLRILPVFYIVIIKKESLNGSTIGSNTIVGEIKRHPKCLPMNDYIKELSEVIPGSNQKEIMAKLLYTRYLNDTSNELLTAIYLEEEREDV